MCICIHFEDLEKRHTLYIILFLALFNKTHIHTYTYISIYPHIQTYISKLLYIEVLKVL